MKNHVFLKTFHAPESRVDNKMQKLNDLATETHIWLYHVFFRSLSLSLSSPFSVHIPILGPIAYGAHFIPF